MILEFWKVRLFCTLLEELNLAVAMEAYWHVERRYGNALQELAKL